MEQSDDVAQPLTPALTPEEWRTRDVRPRAAAIDAWARQTPDEQAADDPTQFVAKLGLTAGGEGVLLMSRAHEVVVIPPLARPALAALALLDQHAGFTTADLEQLHRAVAWATGLARPDAEGEVTDEGVIAAEVGAVLQRVAARIAALLPPAGEA